MPTPSELAEQYLAGAAALRQAVKGMTREQLVARPVAGKWSTLEVVATSPTSSRSSPTG